MMKAGLIYFDMAKPKRDYIYFVAIFKSNNHTSNNRPHGTRLKART